MTIKLLLSSNVIVTHGFVTLKDYNVVFQQYVVNIVYFLQSVKHFM